MKDEELKKYAFCENCLDDVEYEIKYDIPMSGVIKGVEYHYLGIEAYCKKCGALVFTPETNDYNLESLYNVYRKENDIVSLSVIRDIPQKYNIGKRPLSLLLGWGELTFSRYYDGDIPSKQYSEILKRIYAEPSYYSELLEAGKDKLKSSLAYKKSREATDALLDIKIDRRITLAVKYLIYKCEDITALALQKALYYSQGIYCAFFDNFMFSEDCEAWAHGPVYRDIYNIYKDYKFNPITPDSSFDITVLNERERTILDVVAELYSSRRAMDRGQMRQFRFFLF